MLVREADLTSLPGDVHPRLRELLQRCLEKNPKKRYHAIADVRAELDRVVDTANAQALVASPVIKAHSRVRRAVPIVAASIAGAAVGALALSLFSESPAGPIVTRFPLTLPENAVLTNTNRQAIAIAPDGSRLVYIADRRVYLRTMGDVEARPIPGAELPSAGAIFNPVFSPDGQSIAFITPHDRSLKRISIAGGAPITLSAADDPFGMSWSEHGILIGQGTKGIVRVSPDGGAPEQVVAVGAGEQAHGPQLLPDGDTILFTLAKGTDTSRWDTSQIVAHTVSSGTRRLLVSGGTDARYAKTGHLVYVLRGVVFAVPFDEKSLSVRGQPVAVIEGVSRTPGATTGATQMSISDNGTLIYVPGTAGTDLMQRSLALVDRSGAVEQLRIPPAAYETPRMSPDGRQIAVVIDDGREADIWIVDPSGAADSRRLTFGGRNRLPVWSSDSTRVAYQSNREGDRGIFWQRADGSGPAERLTKAAAEIDHRPESWSPNAKLLAFSEVKGNTARILILNIEDRSVTVFAETPSKFVARAAFSPNGRWIAYSSDESGAFEVFVKPYPTGIRYQVGKGTLSRAAVWWSADGKELMFSDGPVRWLAVDVTTEPSFSYGNLRPLPRVGIPNPLGATGPLNYHQTPDGKRMLVVTGAGLNQNSTGISRINVVLNWFEELKQRVPIR